MVAVGIAMAASFAMAAQPPVRRTLSGAEINKAFVGKVATDGHHWTYHMKPDGSIDGVEMGRPRKGHWAILDNRLCLGVPLGAPEQCVAIVREGKGLIFRDNGMDITDVQVAPYRSKQQLQ